MFAQGMNQWSNAAFALLPFLASVALKAEDVEPVNVGSRLEPFFDGSLIAELKGAALRLHPPTPREVVFTFDAPWEGAMSGYVTVLHDGKRYRLYYRGGGDLGREYSCLAFSDDGVHWTRPKLGLIEYRGSKDNNIFWTGKEKAYFESHNFCPFLDTNPAAPPDQRWKAVTSAKVPDTGGDRPKILMAFVSPDGVHWKRLRDEPIITDGAFDSQNTACWDAVNRQYVCFLRKAQKGMRSVARSLSKDFVNWSKPELLDFGDTPPEQFYTNAMQPYLRAPHLYIGLPMRFVPPAVRNWVGLERRKTDGLSDAVFMSSRDGLHWNRAFLEAFIRPGLDPSMWGGAHGNSTPALGVVQTGPEELSIYWSEHYGNYPEGTIIPRLRRGTLRPEGFVSVNAGYAGGEFTTRPLVFTGRRLTMNFSTSAVGGVRVEIQDATGRPLPGYALAEATEIWGDELARVVTWKTGHDLGRLAGQPVRLRFVMKDADVFALRFVD
ncbi:MAG: hypothetical protein AMXMBFR83_31500 [Phycisphaerae bacterium]